jgi:uncharacterized pyridoxal phosphate-containing UPF0001 family protein
MSMISSCGSIDLALLDTTAYVPTEQATSKMEQRNWVGTPRLETSPSGWSGCGNRSRVRAPIFAAIQLRSRSSVSRKHFPPKRFCRHCDRVNGCSEKIASEIELHLIGPLQSNKVEQAIEVFDKIQTIDRLKIAAAVAEHSRRKNRTVPCFIQVNTGAESQKAGVAVEDLPALLNACRHDLGLTIEGLMCIPPVDRPVTPHFALLYRLAQEFGLKELSMGMSADFEQAIQLGATHIRVGSAIFGAR